MQISLVILGCREGEHRGCPNGLVSCSGRGVQSFSRAERCVPLWTRQRRRRCGDLRGWGRRSEMAARMEAADAVRTAAGMEDVALDSSETRPGLIGDGHGPYLQFLSTIARVSSWVNGSRSPVPLAKFHGEGT